MKLKELLLPLTLALLTTLGLQYYFGSGDNKTANVTETGQSGQRFTAPTTVAPEVHKPLKTDIEFVDSKQKINDIVTEIETENARYEFSSYGASIKRLEFKRNWGGGTGYLGTISPPSLEQKDMLAFLVAFNGQTPLNFELVSKSESDDSYSILYKTHLAHGTFHKKYTVFKKSYKMDLDLVFEGVGEEQPRIFFSSPLVAELMKKDVISGIANEGPKTIRIYARDGNTPYSYWSKPSVFGMQDRYFLHTLISDQSGFVNRGYFKLTEPNGLNAILEGPTITGNSSWSLSFYMGPKEDEALSLVDERLDQTLNYGWFSFILKPVSKAILSVLNFLYDYTHNYGIALILLTLLMKLILLPFTIRGERSTKKRVEFQKKMEHLQKKYKNDAEGLAQARAELVKKYGLPGLGGCLPVLLQMPMFWSLSVVFSNSIELYKAPFLWLPDLTAADPYYVLPVLTALGIILHSSSLDPKQRMTSIVMGLFVGAFLASFSSGLTLYIVVSTFLGVAQTYLVKRLSS